MIKVNLVPKELLDREVQKQRKLQGAIVATVAVALVVLVTAMHFFKESRLEHKLAGLQVEYDKLAEIVKSVEKVEADRNALKTRLGAIIDLQKGRPLYPFFMVDLVTTMPPGVWLTGLTTTSKEGTNQLGVATQASASSSEAIAQWLRNLESSGKFPDPALSAINISPGAGGSRQGQFSIKTTYKNPEL